jgi:hypothetical protein
MPIYAPSLPPRPALDQGMHPSLVLARFDFRRLRRQKLGMFFGFAYTISLIALVLYIYVRFLLKTSRALAGLDQWADTVLTQGPDFQSSLITLGGWLTTLLWFQVAFVGGGLIARDTLYRIRPLMYAHPVRPRDYMAAKGLFAAGLPFLIQLPFILLPWAMSLLIAGKVGPVWPTVPLRLIPAALMVSLLMGSITLGASSMASTPRAGFGWVLGIVLGMSSVSFIASQALSQPAWNAINPLALSAAWHDLICGSTRPELGWIPTILGTLAHIGFWTFIAFRRTQPSEAVL